MLRNSATKNVHNGCVVIFTYTKLKAYLCIKIALDDVVVIYM